jgi:hypothetical protein
MPQVRFFVVLGVYTDIYGQNKIIEYLSMILVPVDISWKYLG